MIADRAGFTLAQVVAYFQQLFSATLRTSARPKMGA
jgi:hypothetical protein